MKCLVISVNLAPDAVTVSGISKLFLQIPARAIIMKMKIWDLPTRLFHWMLAASFAGAYFTSRSEWLLERHTVFGYIALGLVAFRVLWGFEGNRFARFSEFVKGWGAVKSYIINAARLKPDRYLGHNPAVGWVVIFVLLLTSAICVTGIITYSGEEGRGAFSGLFSFNAAMYAAVIHDLLADLAVAVIVIHICAALFHDFILKENIIISMITGNKEDPESWRERVSHMQPGEGLSRARLAIWIFVAILAGAGLIYLPPEGRKDFKSSVEPRKPAAAKGQAAGPEEAWKAECASSCHNAFHPMLLPQGSWKKVVSRLNDHFGDNVALDEETKRAVLGYLLENSAEKSGTEASRKILNSLKEGDSPERITDTPYWKVKHSEINDEVYKRKSVVSKSNCVACHPGAEAGSFEDKDILIPKK